jgi:hypothetical protein
LTKVAVWGGIKLGNGSVRGKDWEDGDLQEGTLGWNYSPDDHERCPKSHEDQEVYEKCGIVELDFGFSDFTLSENDGDPIGLLKKKKKKKKKKPLVYDNQTGIINYLQN